MEISKNLPDEKRYVKIQSLTKKPVGLSWNNPKNLLDKKSAEKWLKTNQSIGLALGSGYIAVDCDKLELQQAVEGLIKTKTYIQISGKRELNQYIFKCAGFEDNLDLKFNGKSVGQILGKGKQIILAPSKYQIIKQDVEKEPELNLKAGEIKQYNTLNDIPITEISKDEIMNLILQFETKYTQKAEKEIGSYKFDKSSEIDNLNITSIISTAGMKKDNQGRYFGSSPYHSSTTGHNFWITPSKNLAYCFRCNSGISPAKAIGLNEGILKNCDDVLRGADFIKVCEIAKEKYGLNSNHTNNLNDKQDNSVLKKQGLKFWTFKDYLNYKPPKHFIIDELEYPDEIGMEYGASGSFKSLNMLYKAICISSGKKFLDRFKTKKLPVAILSAENSISIDRERLIAIRRGLNIRKKDTELYILPRGECDDILSLGFKEELFDFFKEKNIKVVYLDTINPLTPELEDTKTKDVIKLFNEFLKKVSEMGIKINFLHHTDKQERNYLGSMKFKGESDCVMRIVREELNNTYEIYNEKNRRGESNTLRVGIDFVKNKKDKLDKIQFKLLDDTGKPKLFKKNKKTSKSDVLKTKILKMLPVGTQIKKTEIKELLDKGEADYSDGTLNRLLTKMVNCKLLESPIKGVYVKC